MDDLIHYWLLQVARAVVWVVGLVTDALFGYTLTHGTREEREKARSYEHSAHVVQIKRRAHEMDLQPHGIKHFLFTHEEYVHPR